MSSIGNEDLNGAAASACEAGLTVDMVTGSMSGIFCRWRRDLEGSEFRGGIRDWSLGHVKRYDELRGFSCITRAIVTKEINR